MKKQYTAGQKVYRLPPLPAYDFQGMEDWLSRLAEEGLFLTKDGFFAGVAIFEAGTPQKLRYRLEAAQKKGGIFSENGGEPDGEQLELSAKYDWEYVARRRDFHIYRSKDPAARELNTDPAVQALALNVVKKRQLGMVIYTFCVFLLYPLLRLKGCLLSAAIALGTLHASVWLLLILLWIAGEMQALTHLRRAQRALRAGETIPRSGEPCKKAAAYFARGGGKLLLLLLFMIFLLRSCEASLMNENEIPVEEYPGSLPFAELRELSGGEDYALTDMGYGMSINCVEERGSGLLSLRYISYNEHGSFRGPDGEMMSGGLYVEYCELRSLKSAKLLFREFYRVDRLQKNFARMEAPQLPADEIIAYRNELHFPTVLFRKGSIVVKAYFYQSTEEPIPMEDWAKILFDSVGGER